MEYVDLVNQALQILGTRTTVTQAELDDESTNEAIQANLVITSLRDRLLRMAPWNCAKAYTPLVYITSQPGTPENQSPATTRWQKGQPAPPWLYEYQYPVDCLRPCWVIAQPQQGGTGVPIFPIPTGPAAAYEGGPPIRYQVSTDQFYPVTAASVVAGGTGYASGDFITLESGPVNEPPIGAPVVIRVTGVNPGGVISTIEVITQILDSLIPQGGSYFNLIDSTQAQDETTGSGVGGTFDLQQADDRGDQRVILTNQQNAILAYSKLIVDPNVWDPLFQDAYVQVVAANLAMALTGDKVQANKLIDRANELITTARTADGNEGLTINDVTPDWIRVRGVLYQGQDPWYGYDWGPLWAVF